MKISELIGGLFMACFGTLFVLIAPVMMRQQRDPNYPIRIVQRLTAVGSDRAFNRSIWTL